MGRLLSAWFWTVVFVISITAMLYLGSNPEEITGWWRWLFGYNVVFSLLAISLIIRHIRILKKQENLGVLGSKLTGAFIKIVPLITILPLLSFYFFSFNSIQGTLIEIERFAQDLQQERQEKFNQLATDLSRLKLEDYQAKTQSSLNFILQNNHYDPEDDSYKATMQAIAQYLVDIASVCDIEIYDRFKSLLAAARNSQNCPEVLEVSNLSAELSLYHSGEFPGEQFFKDQLNYRNDNITLMSINMVYRLDEKSANFLRHLKSSRNTRLNIELNLSPIRNAFLVDLSSTLMLTVLSILMIIFKMIATLMRPLNRLSIATSAVARGDYDVFVEQDSKSDVGILIDLFNQMARAIKTTQSELETERIYLETILKYSYGVIALDEHYRIRLLNPEVDKILKTKNLARFEGYEYLSILDNNPQLSALTDSIKSHFLDNQTEWSENIELILSNYPKLLSCHGAKLETDNGDILGYVIILKDITLLRESQKKAAWSAVAMKMAHEIKNPLTPIQLSAERLRNTLLPKLDLDDKKILDKTTKTIVRQVQSINSLLTAFSDYRQSPRLNQEKGLLSKIIKQVIALYDAQGDIRFSLNVLENEPQLLLDDSSMSRVLINLVKNSIEASKEKTSQIDFLLSNDLKNKQLIFTITDNGAGLSDAIKDKVFAPYASSKSHGSGLGMSIVKNILKAHCANISISNQIKNDKISGAKVEITFKISN